VIPLNNLVDQLNVQPFVVLNAIKDKKIQGKFSRLYHCWIIEENENYRRWVKGFKK
jgi:hypothetical protein